jgi:hypothetical protein
LRSKKNWGNANSVDGDKDTQKKCIEELEIEQSGKFYYLSCNITSHHTSNCDCACDTNAREEGERATKESEENFKKREIQGRVRQERWREGEKEIERGRNGKQRE